MVYTGINQCIVVYTNPLHVCRIPLSLSLRFRTALRRIATIFP